MEPEVRNHILAGLGTGKGLTMAETMREPARRVPVIGRYDVVVLGGGPAGVAAAVSAARGRAKVLLVEQTGCLGGMGTAGQVPAFAPYSRSGKPLIRGIGLEILERLRAAGGVGRDYSDYGWIPINAEVLKRVYDEMVGRERIDLRFFTFFSDVIRRGRRLKAVVFESKAGRQAATADVFIDATGDADVAARAGAPFDKGDRRGRMQAASLCFALAGVDVPRYWAHVNRAGGGRTMDWLREQESRGRLKRIARAEYRGVHGQEIAPGVLGFNFGHFYGVDGTRPEDLARVMVDGRQLIRSFVAFARKRMPGMRGASLVSTAVLPGIRETRRIRGRARLTLDDYLTGRRFDDEIARYDYTVDVHNARRSPALFEKFVREFDRRALPPGRSYGIPYRCLLPVGLDNLLVAGRALSADREAHGSARVMPACFAMGEAAGTAAALSSRRRISPARLDVRLLRRALRLS